MKASKTNEHQHFPPFFGSIKMTSARKRAKTNLLTSAALFSLPPSLSRRALLSFSTYIPSPSTLTLSLPSHQTNRNILRSKTYKHPSLKMPSIKKARQERRQAKYFVRGRQQQDSNSRSQAQAAPQRPLSMSSSASPGNNHADQTTTTNNAREQHTDAPRLGRYIVVRNESQSQSQTQTQTYRGTVQTQTTPPRRDAARLGSHVVGRVQTQSQNNRTYNNNTSTSRSFAQPHARPIASRSYGMQSAAGRKRDRAYY